MLVGRKRGGEARPRGCVGGRTENVVGIPVKQVEVIVVEQLGRVQDALGALWNVPSAPGLAMSETAMPVCVVKHSQCIIAAIGGRGSGGCSSGGRRGRRAWRREREHTVCRLAAEKVARQALFVLLLCRRRVDLLLVLAAAVDCLLHLKGTHLDVHRPAHRDVAIAHGRWQGG
jgi:hypothetical protein